MRFAPIEQTTVYRIPGIVRFTRVEILGYFKASETFGFVSKHTKSVEWKIEPFLAKLLLDPMAVCTFLTLA
jgi:hypothetical protein